MGKDLIIIIRNTRSSFPLKWGKTFHNNHKKNKKLVPPGKGENLNNHKKNKKLFPMNTVKTLINLCKQEVISPWKWGKP